MSLATEFINCVSGDHQHREEGDVKLYMCQETSKPWLRCTRCSWECNIYEYVSNPPPQQPQDGIDYFLSSRLAEKYAKWTGDVNVPVSFHLEPKVFEGIAVMEPVIVPLRQLSNAVQLQRLVNSPFVTESMKEAPQPKIFKHFLEEYLTTVAEKAGSSAAENNSEELVLTQLLKTFESLMHMDIDIFEYYRDTMVPYVIDCASWADESTKKRFPLKVEVEKETTSHPLSMQLLLQWRRSAQIRLTFSKYLASFDVVHIMIALYAVSTDASLVANFAFDLMARVCRGDFFRADTQGKQMVRHILETHASPRTNAELYYALREMRKGRSMDGLSTLMPKYAQLVVLLDQHMPEQTFIRSQAFPAVVFGDDIADYLGFLLAVSHLNSCVDTKGVVPKGVYATARHIHRVVKTFVERMNAFDQGPEKIPWTKDVFQAFLASDADLEEHVREITMMLMNDKKVQQQQFQEQSLESHQQESQMMET